MTQQHRHDLLEQGVLAGPCDGAVEAVIVGDIAQVTFIVPIAFAITVPAEAVTSRLGWETVAVAVGFSAALFAATRWWWGFGLRRYSGASA